MFIRTTGRKIAERRLRDWINKLGVVSQELIAIVEISVREGHLILRRRVGALAVTWNRRHGFRSFTSEQRGELIERCRRRDV